MRLFTLLFFLLFFSKLSYAQSEPAYESGRLMITALSERLYIHTSYLQTESYGDVPCNGMVFVNGGEALIFDTPASNEASEELIRWVEEKLKAKVRAVVATHFHVDCLGGLEAFHTRDIPSYAEKKTFRLAKKSGAQLPEHTFRKHKTLTAGQGEAEILFFGKGHTHDNVIAYIPSEKALFGGCLVKAMKSGKGNLNDADVQQWPHTVQKILEAYPEVEIVIPGHGKNGGKELLKYTVELFQKQAGS